MSFKLHNIQIEIDLTAAGSWSISRSEPGVETKPWSSVDWDPWSKSHDVVSSGDDFVVRFCVLMMVASLVYGVVATGKVMLRSWRRFVWRQRCRSLVLDYSYLSMMAPLACGATVTRRVMV
jgi:hypothetical protein